MTISTTTTDAATAAERRDTEERLVARYGADAEAERTVRAAVADAYDRLAGARVTTFVPVLVERSVRRSLPAA